MDLTEVGYLPAMCVVFSTNSKITKLTLFQRLAFKFHSSLLKQYRSIQMNNYIPLMMISISLSHMLPAAIVYAAETKTVQQVAIERFFVADKLLPDWFTPNSLKQRSLVELQKKRDDLKTRIKQRYGNYKSVQLIEKNKYRIIFENADPNMVIAVFRFDSNDRIDGIDMEINAR